MKKLFSHNNPYQTFIFDLDDTLIDTKSLIKSALVKIYHNYFKSHSSQENFENHFHKINQQVWREVAANEIRAETARIERIKRLAQTLNIDSLQFEDIAMEFTDLISTNASWLPGVEDVFQELCKKYKVIIITNGIKEVQEKRAIQLGILENCCEFLCADNANFAKPNAQIFELALTKTNNNTETTLHIGDSIECDFAGALNANLDFCWINPEKKAPPTEYPKPKYDLDSVKNLPCALSLQTLPG